MTAPIGWDFHLHPMIGWWWKGWWWCGSTLDSCNYGWGSGISGGMLWTQ